MALLLVAIGGGAGGVARHRMANAIGRMSDETFPWGTLAVNLSGALAIGLIAGAILSHVDAQTSLFWLLAVTGFLGGYTTVSSLALQTLGLTQAGLTLRAIVYIGASVAGGVGLCSAGFWLGSSL